jgi:hypothetical protein
VTPTVEQVVEGWIRHFRSADMSMRFTASEHEFAVQLADDPPIVLVGLVDAIGDDWFMEAKTASPRSRSGWREKWRFSVQSLTYGLVLKYTHPNVKRFTIRMAFKSDPPSFDHEWFSYNEKELDTWRAEVIRIAYQMLEPENAPHLALNPLSCYRYGASYPCPFVHACTHAEWDVPVTGLVPREKHDWQIVIPDDALVLSATSIETYLTCPEKFRRIYKRNETEPPSEALTFGKRFHQYINGYYDRLAHGETNPWPYASSEIGA